jgi:DNA-binding PadR family transcriptional regulator
MSTGSINATAASLLGFLHAGPMTGWDLDRTVAASISTFWNVTRSQVYRELHTLADLGYVKAGSAGRRDRLPYTITRTGRRAFAAWIARHPDEPTIRLPFLLTVFFAEHLPPGRLAEIVATERDAHHHALTAFRQLLATGTPGGPFVPDVVRFGIAYHEAFLAWLDGLDGANDA